MGNTRILYGDTLLYRGVSLIHIDRTFDARHWAARKGLVLVDTVTAGGETLEIYINEKRNLACAIPS